MILLDTQAWLYLAGDPDRLSKRAHSAILRASRSTGVAISAYSIWEAAWLRRRGKVRAARSPRDWIDALRTTTATVALPVTPEICVLASELPESIGSDPGDRLISATALTIGCPLVTADERIRASGCVETIW